MRDETSASRTRRTKTSGWVAMTVSTLTVDPFTNMPVVVLKDELGKRSVPIWIGLVEASAIATELEHITLDRPMTHDLMQALVKRLGATVTRVEIHDMRDNTFFARLHITREDSAELVIEARPSDAIALALRANAAIMVASSVVENVREIDLRMEPAQVDLRRDAHPVDSLAAGEADDEGALELLENLEDGAFGKWKM